MNLDRALLLLYVLLPLVAAVSPWPKNPRGGLFTLGSIVSISRVLLLFLLGTTVISSGERITMSGTLVGGYPLDLVLSLDAYRYGFLLMAELCFLLAHWMCSPTAPHRTLMRVLISLAQAMCALFVMSDNSVATGALQILAGVVFFYLIRFSADEKREDVAYSISSRVYGLFFILGLVMIVWGVMEFGLKDLLFSRATSSKTGTFIWLCMVVLSVPISLWSRWFSQAIEFLPEGVTLSLVTVLSAVVLKFSSLLSVVYPDLQWKQKMALYVIGIVGSVFSISTLFSARTRRQMLGSLPGFFLSLVLVSVGVSKSNLVISAYFICLFVPAFTGLILYASVMKLSGTLQRTFIALLLAIVLGLPGTPVFLIFSAIGARSLDLGVTYTLVFVMLWLLYFSANVYICRRFFMDKRTLDTGVDSALESGPTVTYAGYGLFLMCFLILATQIAWRVL